MILEQKRVSATLITVGAATGASVVGAVPTDFADALILVPLETALVKGVLKCYDVKFSADLITAIVGSAAITNVAKAILAKLKAIPNIAGSVLNAIVAGVIVAALGESTIGLAEAIYLGRVDSKKIDEVVDFVNRKMKENPIIGKAVEYMLNHTNELNDRSAKEILSVILEMIKPKK